MTNSNNQNDVRLTAEYQAAQDCVLHYDNFTWQVGSILIAGTFIFWGLILEKNVDSHFLGVGVLLVTLLLSAWFLYAHNCRQIYLLKLHRIREIEKELYMEQHRRFEKNCGTEIKYERFGLKGHCFDRAIYLLTSFGTLFIGCFKIGLDWWLALLALPLIIVIEVFRRAYKNERKLQKQLKKLKEITGC